MNKKTFLTSVVLAVALLSMLVSNAQARRGSGVIVVPPAPPVVNPVSPN